MEWEIYKRLNLSRRVNIPLSKYWWYEVEGLKAFLNKGLSNDLKDNKEEDEYKI